MIAQVPELYDGGYWYTVPVIEVDNVRSAPELTDQAEWSMWEMEDNTALVRAPVPLMWAAYAQVDSNSRPFSRIRGR